MDLEENGLFVTEVMTFYSVNRTVQDVLWVRLLFLDSKAKHPQQFVRTLVEEHFLYLVRLSMLRTYDFVKFVTLLKEPNA